MEKNKVFKFVNTNPFANKYNLHTPEFNETYGKSGVYILYLQDSKGKLRPVYVGHAKTNAGATIARHFQKWSAKEAKYNVRDPQQLDKFYFSFEQTAPDEAAAKETELIEKYFPSFNINKYPHKKNPDLYNLNEERRKALDERVKQYEQEQEAARAYYEDLDKAEQETLRQQAEQQAEFEKTQAANRRREIIKKTQKAGGVSVKKIRFDNFKRKK